MTRTRYRCTAPLRHAVKGSPLTQAELAQVNKLSPTALSLAIHNRRPVSPGIVAKIRRVAEMVGLDPARVVVEIGGTSS